jgi:hypothetical protein
MANPASGSAITTISFHGIAAAAVYGRAAICSSNRTTSFICCDALRLFRYITPTQLQSPSNATLTHSSNMNRIVCRDGSDARC